VCKNQNYLKNKVKLKSQENEFKTVELCAAKIAGEIKMVRSTKVRGKHQVFCAGT
jgi:hypothetical protein